MSKNTNLSFLTDYITADITNGRIGINNASPTVAFDVSGATKISGVLTLSSTISNGTFAYTLPGATGTLALTSALSGYLPLTGGTLTGALVGTSATFVGTIIQQNITDGVTLFGQKTQEGTMRLNIFSTNVYTAIQTVTATSLLLGANNATNLTIASTGAATFSSSVTNQVTNISADGAGVVLQGYVDNILRIAVRGSGYNDGQRGGLLASTGDFSSTLGVTGAATFLSSVTATSYNATTQNIFAVDGTERMRITSAGNVGIGTSSPSQKLEVVGTTHIISTAGNITGVNIIPGSVTNLFQTIGDGALGGRCFANIETGYANYDNASSSYMNFKTQSSPATTSDVSIVQMQIRPTGDIRMTVLSGSGTRTVVADANGQLSAPVSDITLKENIIPIGYGLNEIMQMNPVWFDFIDGYKNYGEGRQNGNIAQEIKAIIPEAVFTTPQTGKMGINYEQLHAVYIKAIQELSAENTSLINRIEALENK